MDYFKNLSLLNANKFVNDENINRPLYELKNNIDYLLQFVDGNKTLLSGVFGNLLDFNKEGRRITFNGGKFDSYKKVHLWTAYDKLEVSNDKDLFWDSDNKRLVYSGVESSTESRSKWFEREIFIPENLRDQHLIFAIKASGCQQKFNWTENNFVCEDIAIEILGPELNVKKVVSVGKWENHGYFENFPVYSPKMITQIIPFKTSKFTDHVRIKIYRTVNENYLHVDKMYLGLPTISYFNNSHKYEIKKIDINEFFDFDNNCTKLGASHVLGHKVPDVLKNIVGNDLMTWYYFNIVLRNLMYKSSFLKSGSNNNFDILNENELDIDNMLDLEDVQGVINCNTTNRIYTVNHLNLDKSIFKVRLVTVETPWNSQMGIPPVEYEQIYATICNIQDSSFQVVLSDFPPTDGYKIHWFLGNIFSPKKFIQSLSLPTIQNSPPFCIDKNIIQNDYNSLFNYE